MAETLQDYLVAEPLPLPAVHPDPKIIKVTSFSVFCGQCGAATSDIRGEVRTHTACLEIMAGGACWTCGRVTWSRTRLYAEHFLAWRKEGLMMGGYSVAWPKRVKAFFRWLKQMFFA